MSPPIGQNISIIAAKYYSEISLSHRLKEENTMIDDCFQLKGSVITTFILEFNDFDVYLFEQQLNTKVSASPDFFRDSPVIIDFSKIDLTTLDINYQQILTICRDNGMQPIAFRQCSDLDIDAINDTNLALIDHKSTNSEKNRIQKTVETPQIKETKIISKPIRSGQQIYAEDCDLIILGSVSGGAEVLADGNIHIYGTLRGRALAGVKGNTNARIFCSNNEAELVSINGHFLINDSLETQAWKQSAHFYLVDETLHVDEL